MIDLKFIRQNPELIRNAILVKKIDLNLDNLFNIDAKVLELKKQLQAVEEEKNINAREVPKANNLDRPLLIEKGRKIGQQIEEIKSQLKIVEEELQKLLWLVPNIPAAEAPVGATEDDNVEIKRYGTPKAFSFKPLDHVEILEKHNWAELERVAKVSGSRSYSLVNDMVLLEMALLRFSMEKMKNKGFNLITVPAFAREFAFIGTGHFPVGKEQVYFIPEDDLYLTGTSEVVLNALHSGEILKETDLPILYAGFSPCFRREAGSAGKDTRGLIRLHQFYKVEQFVIGKNDPSQSAKWHQQLLEISEEIIMDLELPYRVVDVCTGDMGAGKVRQFDIEAWVPSEQKYRETHSCSSLHEWQARRTNLRYRDLNGKMQYCHTLNNTAIATPRIMVPFLENHQNSDGTINIPAKLQPFMGGATKLG
ncbi:MAG: serine--tRNA ligase [Gammaproteobacteria bacterium]|jgi:seryl-tRNA synthetase